MAEHGNAGRLSKREEREQRILDATAELLQKWGYRKTTLEDIARRAGVAKATIALSWKTREELFMALIEREQALLYADVLQLMQADPEGMTLPALAKYSTLATLKNPLMKALALQDTEFLGELVTRRLDTTVYQAYGQAYMAMLDILRACGVIRSDIDLLEQVITISSVSWGFLLVDPLLPEGLKLSDERLAERVYLTLKRLLEPDIPPTDEQRRVGERAFQAFIEQCLVINPQQEQSRGDTGSPGSAKQEKRGIPEREKNYGDARASHRD